ncbi:MAG: DUF3363 domain-containing protein [Bradyrhizobium sp.]
MRARQGALGGDEMGERVRLVIDTVDGGVHHIEMDRAEDFGRGMIVAAGSATPRSKRPGSQHPEFAGQGVVYARPNISGGHEWTSPGSGGNLAAFLRSHVRRLEALRGPPMRAGSTPITAVSPPIFPSVVKPTIWRETAQKSASASCLRPA